MNLLKHVSIGQNTSIKVEKDVNQMQNILKREKIEHTLKNLSGSHHLRSLKAGFEIEYSNNRIETFFAYFRTKKFDPFKGTLPHGINQKWTLRSAVLYFGEPKIKSNLLIEIIYENLGIGLVFQGHWSRDDSPIDYCYFFEPSNENICSNCKKSVKSLDWRCNCQAAGYCSVDCKIKHLGIHNIICCSVDESFPKILEYPCKSLF